MRRTSSWVTGVPLPGWMFSAAITTPSLPSISTIFPLRNELAMTFTVSLTSMASGLSLGFRRHHTDLELSPHYFLISRQARNMLDKAMPQVRPSSLPFWAARIHADRRPILLARGRIVASLRGWFAAHDFVEVETATLRISPGNETHLHAFATSLMSNDGR